MTVFLVILFLIQIIVTYFLVLLYTKVSKFDDLEKKQRKLMNEMDDSIGAYLAELKDENERLIAKLAERKTESLKQTPEESLNSAKTAKGVVVDESQPKPIIDVPKVPVNIALKSYVNASAVHVSSSDDFPEQKPVDDRTRAFELYRDGHTIETIAKKLEKGKTEVELMLKFK